MDSQIDASRDRSDKLNATASRFLTADEERHLITCWQDARDKRALDRIVRAFAPLVARHAHALRKYTDQRDDLIQEGNIALMEAISRFDSERGARFGTYASWWVKARMQDYVLSNRSVVRIPRSREKKSLFFKMRHLEAKQFQNGTDDRQAVETVSAALNIPVGDVVRVAALMSGDQAMEAPVPATGMEFGSMLADPAPGPEETVAARQSIDAGRLLLDEAMDDLSDRERKIIKARKLTEAPRTLKELAADFGVSTERVRQIEGSALIKLREAIETSFSFPVDLLPDSPSFVATGRSGTVGQALY